MPVSLSGRKFTKLLDFTPDEIRYLVTVSYTHLTLPTICSV